LALDFFGIVVPVGDSVVDVVVTGVSDTGGGGA
jgi:hypothetical protein